jgi:transcriptional regulator with XRE-family HTH domain
MEEKSMRQLAKELGVSASYLSQVKNGKRPASVKLLSSIKHNFNPNIASNKMDYYVQTTNGTPGATRTPDTRFRKPLLCPPELLGLETRHAKSDVNLALQA